MWSWLLSASGLRSHVELERRVAVAETEVAFLRRENGELRERADALQRRYDRLVEARLFRQGDITAPLSDPAPKPASPLLTMFGAIGRLDQPAADSDGLPMSS